MVKSFSYVDKKGVVISQLLLRIGVASVLLLVYLRISVAIVYTSLYPLQSVL